MDTGLLGWIAGFPPMPRACTAFCEVKESESSSVVSDSLRPHGLYSPSPGDLPNPGIEPKSPMLQTDALPSEPPGKPFVSLSLLYRWTTYAWSPYMVPEAKLLPPQLGTGKRISVVGGAVRTRQDATNRWAGRKRTCCLYQIPGAPEALGGPPSSPGGPEVDYGHIRQPETETNHPLLSWRLVRACSDLLPGRNHSYRAFSVCLVPWHPLHALSQGGGCYPHCTDEETKPQRGYVTDLGHIYHMAEPGFQRRGL